MIKTFETFDSYKHNLLEFIKSLPKSCIKDNIQGQKLSEIAKETSKNLGLKIHQDYIIDLPYTASTLEGIVYSIIDSKNSDYFLNKYLDLLFEYLKSKNPDLIKLSNLFNGIKKIYIITGILSAFSIDDIHFYCKQNPRRFFTGEYYLNGEYDDKYTELITYISKYIRLNYFPSIETLLKIKKHIFSIK